MDFFLCSQILSRMKHARTDGAGTSARMHDQSEDLGESSDDAGTLINETRVEAKGIAIRAKVVATLSKLLYEANLCNEVGVEQVCLKWGIVAGKVQYFINAWCPLCGISLAVPLIKETICGQNFQRHLKRKHSQGTDPELQAQKQTKLNTFFRTAVRCESCPAGLSEDISVNLSGDESLIENCSSPSVVAQQAKYQGE